MNKATNNEVLLNEIIHNYTTDDRCTNISSARITEEDTRNKAANVGDIYFIKSSGTEIGTEERKTRPHVLLNHTSYGGLWEAAPLAPGQNTRCGKDNDNWFRTSASGRDCVVLLNQRKHISEERILNYVGKLEKGEMCSLIHQISNIYKNLENEFTKQYKTE